MTLTFTNQEIEIISNTAKAASNLKMEAFVVGGFVRDKILNRPCMDIDIVCLGDANELALELSRLYPFEPKVSWFKNYGTAHVRIGKYDVEFVGARKESYLQHSRNPIVEAGTLQDDQERRDFTINALAFSVDSLQLTVNSQQSTVNLIDPFNGIGDLENKIIRTPLSPEKTFSDDPLRMMRAIRFASQLNFSIDPNTLQGIHDSAHRISIISQERITDELNKILMSDKPSVGLDLLYTCGLLKLIFPAL
ncbi:MAG: hypothetical protein RLZ76_467, partial [Bacteroidota bacterium]